MRLPLQLRPAAARELRHEIAIGDHVYNPPLMPGSIAAGVWRAHQNVPSAIALSARTRASATVKAL